MVLESGGNIIVLLYFGINYRNTTLSTISDNTIDIAKIFRRKDITLTRNRVIRNCIQNTLVPPIAGYF